MSATQDQQKIFGFLSDPRTYGRDEPVIRIDTHAAVVFLAGPDVYKVKRAIRFPFLDFSTIPKRRAACEAEIAVNRVNAPDLYLGVVPIACEDGVLHLGGDGRPVEWAVHLRRFDETATLDRLADKGPLGPDLTDKLAQAVTMAHRRAPIRDGNAATQALRGLLLETLEALTASPALFPAEQSSRFGIHLTSAFQQVESLLLRRGAQGQVRRCHGDLHLGNLVLIDGDPVLFDAIEFDEAIATIDTLYDLAFLVMDLCKRGLRDDANRLLNRYLAFSEDESLDMEGLAAFPVLLALRATIRAKVVAAQYHLDAKKPGLRETALSYFEAATQFLEPVPPRLVAIGGLSGTGKTTLAAALAPAFGRAPGAVHLRSDVERKRLFKVPETTRLPADAYRPEVSAAVHDRLADLAETALSAGAAAIIDATFQDPRERQRIAAVAAHAGVPFVGVWLDAPVDLLVQRVAGRRGDASDATPDVVGAQAGQSTGEISWSRFDAGQSLASLKAAALAMIEGVDSQVSGKG
jgi:hypothetical protein